MSYDGLLQYLSPWSPFCFLRFLILLLLFLFSLNLYLLLYICPIALLLRFWLRRERLYGAPLPSRVLLKNGAEFVNVDEGFPRVGLGPCEAAAQSVSKLHRRQEGRQGLRVSGLQVSHDFRMILRVFGAMFHKLDYGTIWLDWKWDKKGIISIGLQDEPPQNVMYILKFLNWCPVRHFYNM